MPSLDFETEKSAFRDFYNDNAQRLEQAKDVFLTLLGSLLAHGHLTVADTTGRIKDREECIKKFTRKYQSKLERDGSPYEIREHISDLIGLRLVCLYEDEIEKIGDLLRDHFNVIEVSDKTTAIESTENAFGYKGLHLDLKLDASRAILPEYAPFASFKFEVQIRSVVQDSWSRIDHKIKYKKSIPPSLKRRINTLAALFELADREFRQIRDETKRYIEEAQREPEGNVGDSSYTSQQHSEDDVQRGQYAPLNAFRFLKIAKHFFPDFEFDADKVDGFTSEVIRCEPNVSRGKFNFYMKRNISLVKRYKNAFESVNPGKSFNAFTQIRHALYIANGAIYGEMLTNLARDSFNSWLATYDVSASHIDEDSYD